MMRLPIYCEFDPRMISLDKLISNEEEKLNYMFEKFKNRGSLEHISTGKIIDDSELHFLQAIYYI